jgi:hypothetical protein
MPGTIGTDPAPQATNAVFLHQTSVRDDRGWPYVMTPFTDLYTIFWHDLDDPAHQAQFSRLLAEQEDRINRGFPTGLPPAARMACPRNQCFHQSLPLVP